MLCLRCGPPSLTWPRECGEADASRPRRAAHPAGPAGGVCLATPGDDGFAAPHLWTGIGVARSGVGAAILGDPNQVVTTLLEYAAVGVDCFILSGYPLDDEARRVAEWVLPRLA